MMKIVQKAMKKMVIFSLFLTLVFSNLQYISNNQGKVNIVETYALLVDQFAPNSNSPGQYLCNAIEFRNSLLSIGWDESNFYYLFGDEEITVSNVQAKMNLLIQTVDENDVVICFFATHGYGCLRDMLNFNLWFHDYFLDIKTDYKYLLIDACHAGEFIEPLDVYESTESFYAMGSVAPQEYAIGFVPDDQGEEWVYTEPEFLGIISSHFWSQTLTNSSADVNSDSYVDMGEMYDYSLPIIKKIYNEIFLADSDIAEFIMTNTGYIDNYPRPVVINSLSENISLYSDYLMTNIESIGGLTQPQKLGIIFGSIGSVIIITVIVFSVVRIKKKSKSL